MNKKQFKFRYRHFLFTLYLKLVSLDHPIINLTKQRNTFFFNRLNEL